MCVCCHDLVFSERPTCPPSPPHRRPSLSSLLQACLPALSPACYTCLPAFCCPPALAPSPACYSLPTCLPCLLPACRTQVLNEMFGADLKRLISALRPRGSGMQYGSVSEVVIICIDAGGVDIRVRAGSNSQEFNVERIGFDSPVSSLPEAIAAMQQVVARHLDPLP